VAGATGKTYTRFFRRPFLNTSFFLQCS